VDNESPNDEPLSDDFEPLPPPPPSIPDENFSAPTETPGNDDDEWKRSPSSSSQNDAPERQSRVRDRQRRRQERKGGPMAVRTSERPAVRTSASRATRPMSQVSPTGAFKLPEIKIPQGRLLLYLAGGIFVIVAIIVGLGRLKNNPTVAPPNALWLGTEWTYALDENAKMPDLVARLQAQKIGTVYAWVSWLKEDDTLGGRKEEIAFAEGDGN